jgi:hypothetical protein
MLYIDSGVQKWNGTDVSPPTIGINSYIITIPLNSSWDWKTNITEQAEVKNVTNVNTGTLPPSQIRGHMFHGPASKPEVFVYGGTTYMGNTSFMANQSFEAYASPNFSPYPLWSYTYGSPHPWSQYPGSTAWMPNHGAAAEAIDQGLGFYLNGRIDWGTSYRTLETFPKTEALYIPLSGMIVLDLNTQSSKNISTPNLRGGAPRVGGSMEYIATVGRMGALVALGGQIQPNLTGIHANVSEGELVGIVRENVLHKTNTMVDRLRDGRHVRHRFLSQGSIE